MDLKGFLSGADHFKCVAMDIKIDNYYQILVQNARKGERYRIKLKGSTLEYNAIPLIQMNFDVPGDGTFMMKIFEPAEYKGIQYHRLEDIDTLEKEV